MPHPLNAKHLPDLRMNSEFKFLTESTLGKLAKLLRTAGFDTVHDKRRPDSMRLIRISRAHNRILLSRTVRVVREAESATTLFILSNKPDNQFIQVMAELAVQETDLRPMTRCTLCNSVLASCDRLDVIGLVPDYIVQTHDHFRLCPNCGKFYWPGTHAKRMKTRLAHMTGSLWRET